MHHLNKVELASTEGIEFASGFAEDVFLGLSHRPKWLSSKYFYDEAGDKIFQEIMHMESYYLTRSELDIFERHKADILKDLVAGGPFRMIELGAGDGLKTRVLLRYFMAQGVDFEYAPCDISGHVLEQLEQELSKELPDLPINLLEGDYFHALKDNALSSSKRSVVLFLGSNIGNFSHTSAVDFLKHLRDNMKEGDVLLTGFDLKKDPNVILKAYNDPDGITARFNHNLLNRINKELGADFDASNFKHHPIYDPVSGECRSYLLSKKDQDVFIKALDHEFHFRRWEPIFMEISKKYDRDEIRELAFETGFKILGSYMDQYEYFLDSIWEAI